MQAAEVVIQSANEVVLEPQGDEAVNLVSNAGAGLITECEIVANGARSNQKVFVDGSINAADTNPDKRPEARVDRHVVKQSGHDRDLINVVANVLFELIEMRGA